MTIATPTRPQPTGERTDQEPSESHRTHYRPDIDGIRGTAAIMVMGYHANVPGFEGGFIGLDLFFVVSGFVIAGLLLGEFDRTGRIRWGAFYARRARRLIPAKATMLIGVLILSYFVMTPGGAQETARSAAAAGAFVSNFFFWQIAEVDYFANEAGTGALLHTWSLSVEEQFYLSLPLCVLLAWVLAKLLRTHVARTLMITALVLGAASLWGAMTIADTSPSAAYYLPITRAFEFLAGVLLALIVRKVQVPTWLRQVMGLVGGLICAYVLWRPMPTDTYPDYWALIPCLGAFLMIWAGTGSRTAISYFLGFPLFVWLGLVSYGWYLWHWPLLVMGEAMNLAQPVLWIRVVLVLVALAVAILSYRFVEGIFYSRSGRRKAVRRYGGPRVVLTGVTAMATVITLAGGAFVVAKEQASSPKWQAISAQLSDAPEMPEECLDGARLIPEQPVACELTPYEEDRPTTVLWGDSHAWMFIPALMEAIEDEGQDVNLVVFTQGSCPPMLTKRQQHLPCVAGNQMAMEYVAGLAKSDQEVQVILGASWQAYFEAEPLTLYEQRNPGIGHLQYVARISNLFENGGPRLFGRLGRLGVDVDVIAPTAVIGRVAPICVARARPYSCNRPRSTAILHEEEVRDWLDEQMARLEGETHLIDVTGEMCDESTCYATHQGAVSYFDDRHISASFSRTLEEYFEPTVDFAEGAT